MVLQSEPLIPYSLSTYLNIFASQTAETRCEPSNTGSPLTNETLNVDTSLTSQNDMSNEPAIATFLSALPRPGTNTNHLKPPNQPSSDQVSKINYNPINTSPPKLTSPFPAFPHPTNHKRPRSSPHQPHPVNHEISESTNHVSPMSLLSPAKLNLRDVN